MLSFRPTTSAALSLAAACAVLSLAAHSPAAAQAGSEAGNVIQGTPNSEQPDSLPKPRAQPRYTWLAVAAVGDYSMDGAGRWTFHLHPKGGAYAEWEVAPSSTTIHFDVTPDGRELHELNLTPGTGFTISTNRSGEVELSHPGRGRWSLRPVAGGKDDAWTKPYLGRWTWDGGQLTVRNKDGVLLGDWLAPGGQSRSLAFAKQNGRIIGAWAGSDGFRGDEATLYLSDDGRQIGGTLWGEFGTSKDWRAVRIEAAPQTPPDTPRPPGPAPVEPKPADPPPTPPEPMPGPGPSNPPADPPKPFPTDPVDPAPDPNPVASFQPLRRVDVRLDRIEVARGYPTHQVHAFLTIKNASASPQYFTSGFLKVVLADADGVTWERSQPYRASREPAELFASTPAIQPGGELKVRYVFQPEEGVSLVRLMVIEGDQTAQFTNLGVR